MLQFFKGFKIVKYDLTINIIAEHTFKVTNIAFFTFSVSSYLTFYTGTLLARKGLWATVTRRINWCVSFQERYHAWRCHQYHAKVYFNLHRCPVLSFWIIRPHLL